MKTYRRVRYRIQAQRIPESVDSPSIRESLLAELRRAGHRDCRWIEHEGGWVLTLPPSNKLAKPGNWVIQNSNKQLTTLPNDRFRKKFEACGGGK